MKHIATIGLSLVCLGAFSSLDAASLKKTLSSVPAAELPAKAAQLIADTKTRDQKPTTINVVKTALGINPAAAPAIVGAIARAVGPMASVAAGTAAEEQPKQACAIAKAAAAAAPSEAGQIVLAVCRAAPSEYRCIAVAVSEVAPDASKEILEAVAIALPELGPDIASALEHSTASGPSVPTTLDNTITTKTGGNPKGPPVIPSSPPTGLPPGSGKNYAKPF